MVHSQRGFTLVELSIVLVIVGLLVGGIIAGQSLIRASELRNVTTEYNRYSIAAQTFQDKYFGLPGDIATATTYWDPQDGAGGGSSAACKDSVSTDTKTCNGNGDGILSYSTPTYSNEIFRFWQHLANAGLIEGSYTGTAYLTGTPCSGVEYCSQLGVNAPKSRMTNGGWVVFNIGTIAAGHPQWFQGVYNNIFFFGSNPATSYTSGVILKPEEAYNIDKKLDDGMPSTGKVRSWDHSFEANCADTNTTGSAVYQLTLTSVGCALIFDM